ncbi:serine/threonine-protein kinase [Nonomuraea harbinensis]|uniref:Serine/threonine-protein kinase n=1 Tax=Nonomuraea harbinensis TaxID=1286938 RepID=A0ABW1BQH9_9ACTN|nr:serine/threonine-protein kinase [Nonomuraea harbinensis]
MSDRVIGGYALRRVLGRGGMGEVHLAATPTGGLAAVKVIHPRLARDPAFRRRFEREVAAARRVARFCTAPVLDAGIDGDVAYLVTEYVKGPDLARAVRDQGPLSGGNLEALAVGIATALSAIHGAGVIHRDLKPSNVLLSPLGPRVIDFGIAQLVGSDTSQAILGTPAFMAPEQARGETVGPFTDVFAWGGVIAFAGTGRSPFGGGSPGEVLNRVVHGRPHLDGLDDGVRGLVEQALAKDPRARPPVSRLLADLLGGPPTSPASATEAVERTWTTPLTRPPSPSSGSTTSPQPAPTSRSAVPYGPEASPTYRGAVPYGGVSGAAGGSPALRGDPQRTGAAAEGGDAVPYGGSAVSPQGAPASQGGGAVPYGGSAVSAQGAPASQGEGAVPYGPEASPSSRGAVYGGSVLSAQGGPDSQGVVGGARKKGRGGVRWRWWVGGLVAVVVGVAVAGVLLRGEAWPYESGFADGWEVGASEAGTAEKDGSGYVLAVEDGWRLWKSAPRREPGGGVVVSAKAELREGAGEYGVWCHGGSGGRYEFGVSGAGRVAIVKRRTGQEGVVLYGPEKAASEGTNRVVAECAGGDGEVTLRMWLNERLVAEATDAEAPLGPGMAGVHAAPEAGKTVRVRFESFALRPARG